MCIYIYTHTHTCMHRWIDRKVWCSSLKRICVSTHETRVFIQERQTPWERECTRGWQREKDQDTASDASDGKSVSEESQRAGNCVRNLIIHGLAKTSLRPNRSEDAMPTLDTRVCSSCPLTRHTCNTNPDQIEYDHSKQYWVYTKQYVFSELKVKCTKSQRK